MEVERLDVEPRIVEYLKSKGIRTLYPPQWDALNSGVLNGRNLVMATPTASGKTLVAEIAILNKILKDGGKALYLTPLKAIATEKYKEFRGFERLGVRVAVSTGDLDSSDPHLAKYNVIIATNEKADSLIRHEAPWLEEVDIIVVDEIHYIDDPKRGPVIESVIARVKEWGKSQIIGLSATISNAREIAEWIGASLVYSEWRPVPLREGVYCGGRIIFDDGSEKEIDVEVNEPVIDLTIDVVKSGGQALIFTSSRSKTVSLASKISRVLGRRLGLEDIHKLNLLSRELSSSSNYTKLNSKLSEVVSGGVSFHHAGLSYEQRVIIEEAFREGALKAIVATPTLAAGVNLPARRVIIHDYTRYEYGLGRTPIKVLEYKQFAGRAGRPGYDEVGEAIIIARRVEEADMLFDLYIYSQTERLTSKLGSESNLRSQVLALIATRRIASYNDILRFIENTLFHIQYGSFGIRSKIRRVVEFLESEGMILNVGSKYKATRLGLRVSQLYIDPLTASKIVSSIDRLKPNTLTLLLLICGTPDMLKLNVRRSEIRSIREFIDENYDLFPEPPEYLEESEDLFSQVKTAMLLNDWVNEMSEDYLGERYDIGPGDLYMLVETADWLLYSADEILKITGAPSDVRREIGKLRGRVKYGVREELLELVRLEGIGRVRSRLLYDAGFRTLQDLRRASIESITRVKGIGRDLAVKIKKQLGLNVEGEDVKEAKPRL